MLSAALRQAPRGALEVGVVALLVAGLWFFVYLPDARRPGPRGPGRPRLPPGLRSLVPNPLKVNYSALENAPHEPRDRGDSNLQ